MAFQNEIKADGFRPLHENVFVTDLDNGLHITKGGIIRPDDNMQAQGIRPRWGRVWAIGPEVEDLEVDEWIYDEHARWTNAIDLRMPEGTVRVWRVEYPKSVLLASKEDPREALWTGR